MPGGEVQWNQHTKQNVVELLLDVDRLAICRDYACNRYVSELLEILLERTNKDATPPSY